MTTIEGKGDAAGMRVGIVASRWNEFVVKALVEGAVDELRSLGDPEIVLVWVPGAWEIPPAAKALIDASRVDAIVALGCILQGATPHAGFLAGDVGSSLMSLQTSSGVPISWGVLTPDTAEQALDRAGLKMGNKGREAASAAVATLSVVRQIRRG